MSLVIDCLYKCLDEIVFNIEGSFVEPNDMIETKCNENQIRDDMVKLLIHLHRVEVLIE